MIGICLGFQQILFCEGAKIVEQKKIYHGFQSAIKVVNDKSLFKKGKIFKVGRYHSLKLKEPFKINNFDITMRCLKSKVAMSFENNEEKIYGFQFHPESFLTINGNLLIKKSYQLKNLKETNFKDLWGDHGIFTTMWIFGKPPKILFFEKHIDNLIKSLNSYGISKKILKKIF